MCTTGVRAREDVMTDAQVTPDYIVAFHFELTAPGMVIFISTSPQIKLQLCVIPRNEKKTVTVYGWYINVERDTSTSTSLNNLSNNSFDLQVVYLVPGIDGGMS